MSRLVPALCVVFLSTPAFAQQRAAAPSHRIPRLGLDGLRTDTSNAPEETRAPEEIRTPEETAPRTPQATAAARGDESRQMRRLQRQVERLVRQGPTRGVRVGVVVADADTGTEWVHLRGEESFNPASTLKLFTSAVALDRLGGDHRFKTEIRVIGKTVYLRGTGDPMLSTDQLAALVDDALPALQAIDTIEEVVVDPNAFRGGILPPGYSEKETDASYRAATGAVALDYGAARVEVYATREGRPPRVVITPPGGYALIQNNGRTVSGSGATIRIRLQPAGDRSRVIVSGRIGRGRSHPVYAIRRLEHPPIAAGYAFRHLLRDRGLQVENETIRLSSTPEEARTVASHDSLPLVEIIRAMNKHSNNFIAEMLLRGLARSSDNAPPGTWRRGTNAVQQFLTQEVGIASGSFEFRNGSGLYNGGQFSPQQVVQLLLTMNRHPDREAYRDSLAVAGQDGTLRNRLRGGRYARRVIGKTGTLNDVSALSGYARNRSGRLFAFSILMNETNQATRAMRRLQDRICALLIDHRMAP